MTTKRPASGSDIGLPADVLDQLYGVTGILQAHLLAEDARQSGQKTFDAAYLPRGAAGGAVSLLDGIMSDIEKMSAGEPACIPSEPEAAPADDQDFPNGLADRSASLDRLDDLATARDLVELIHMSCRTNPNSDQKAIGTSAGMAVDLIERAQRRLGDFARRAAQ